MEYSWNNIGFLKCGRRKSMKYDLIITIPDTSVGKYDLIHQSLKKIKRFLQFLENCYATRCKLK